MMRRLALALAIVALPTVSSAQATRCIPQDQAAALVTFALPSMVERLAERCGPELPRNAYLSANARLLADRWRPEASAAWPTARRAIAQLFTQFLGQPMPEDMNGDMVRMLAEPALAELLSRQISTADCATADQAIASVAPLGARDLGRLAAIAATIADRKGKGIAGVLGICKTEARR